MDGERRSQAFFLKQSMVPDVSLAGWPGNVFSRRSSNLGAHKEIVTEVFTYDSWPHDLRTEKAKISEEAEAVEAAPKFEPDIFTLDIFGSSYEGSAGFFR